MTNEERDLISQFVARTGGRPVQGNFAVSVPQAGGPDLPPVEPQADALIAELFGRYPEARYRITQLAFIQEHALAAASNQIQQLQTQIQQLQQQIAQQQQAPAASPWGATSAPPPQQSRGFFGGLFGGGQPTPPPQQPQYAAPPPQYAAQPQYAPGYQPGMFQPQGSGFLGSALRTATGVAGGVLAAEAISSLFSPHHAYGAEPGFGGGYGGGGFGGGGFGGAPGTVVNETNYINQGGAASPWGGAATDPYDQGGAAKTYDSSGWGNQPAQDSGWQDAGQSDSGWQDASSSGDSGWTDSGGDSDS